MPSSDESVVNEMATPGSWKRPCTVTQGPSVRAFKKREDVTKERVRVAGGQTRGYQFGRDRTLTSHAKSYY